MKKLICLFTFIVYIFQGINAQSLETQLKLIFGDILSTYGKNQFSRTLGKGLSMSGGMQYEFEKAGADNTYNYNINTNAPPVSQSPYHQTTQNNNVSGSSPNSPASSFIKIPSNTYLSLDNKIFPNEGYEWANPGDPLDYNVKKINRIGMDEFNITNIESIYNIVVKCGREIGVKEYFCTKDTYLSDVLKEISSLEAIKSGVIRKDILEMNDFSKYRFLFNLLGESDYALPQGASFKYIGELNVPCPQLKQVFTCKWVYDLNGDGKIEFSEIRHIKRNLKISEDFLIVSNFFGSKEDSIIITKRIFDDYSGKMLAEIQTFEDISYSGNYVSIDKISGNILPPGTYLIAVEMQTRHNEKSNTTFSKTIIEIIPDLNLDSD